MTPSRGPNDAAEDRDRAALAIGRQAARQLARRQVWRAGAQRRESRPSRDVGSDASSRSSWSRWLSATTPFARTEREAGQALIAITRDEGEAVEWCGGALSLREASPLRSLRRSAETSDPPRSE